MQKEEIYKKFEELDKVAALGGGVVRIDKQHEAGRMTARERIDMLLDKGTFVELDKFVTHRCTNFGMEKNKIPGDGVVSGYGKIEGRQVMRRSSIKIRWPPGWFPRFRLSSVLVPVELVTRRH